MERRDLQFWIDRRGKMIKINKSIPTEDKVSLHFEIADSIYPNEPDPEGILMAKGWIKYGSMGYGGHIMNKQLTHSQIDTLLDLNQLRRLLIYDDGVYKKFLTEYRYYE